MAAATDQSTNDSANTPWTIHVHGDVHAWMAEPHNASARGKAQWSLLELALRGRTSRVKGTVNQPWRRTPVAGNAWYLTWAPGGASGLGLGGRRVVWVRAVREHDATGTALSEGEQGDYVPLAPSELDPRTDAQRDAIPRAVDACVRQVAGPPGSGKTLTLLFATRSPGHRALYITSSPALARSARAFFDTTAADVRVVVATLDELRARLLGVDADARNRGRASFDLAVARSLRPELGPWLHSESALWAELRGVTCGLPQAFPFRRGTVDVLPTGILDESTYAAVSDLPATAMQAARSVARVAEREGWLDDLDQARAAAATLDAHGVPDWLADVDLIAVDEAQDLAPVEVGLVVELGRAIAKGGGAPHLYFAGDDSQTLLPSGFDWGIVGDLAFQRLGVHVSRFDLDAQLRQPARHADLVTSAARLYRSVARSLRPFVARNASNSQAPGRLIVVDDDVPPTLAELVESQPGRAVISLEHEPGDDRVFTPEDIKGLERDLVVVTGLASTLGRMVLLADTASANGDLIRERELRREIDRLRVALSRSTDTLVIWGPGSSEALRSISPETRFEAFNKDGAVALLDAESSDDAAWAFLDEARELFDRGDATRGHAALERAVRAGAADTPFVEEVARLVADHRVRDRILVPSGDAAAFRAALEQISVGGTVELQGGTFEIAGLVFTRDVRIEGRDGAVVLSQSANVLMDVRAGMIRMSNLSLRVVSTSADDSAVIRVSGGEMHAERCRLEGPATAALVEWTGGGGSLSACHLRNAGRVGVHVSGGSSPLIEACGFAGVPVGLRVSSNASPSVRDSVFTTPTTAVEITDANGSYSRNRIIGATRHAFAVRGPRGSATIEQNDIEGGGVGVLLERGATARLLGNRIKGTTKAALDVLSGANAQGEKNTLVDIQELAVRVEAATAAFDGDRVSGGKFGYSVSGQSSLTLRDGRIEGGAAIGVQALDGASVTLERCHIERMGIGGVQATGARTTIFVRDTDVRGSGRAGVSVVQGHALIEHCRFRRNGDGEVAADEGAEAVVRDSTLDAVPTSGLGVVALKRSRVTVERCLVRGDRGALIAATGSRLDVVDSVLHSKRFGFHLTELSSAKSRETEMLVSRKNAHFWVEPGCVFDFVPKTVAPRGSGGS